jgi:RHH-type proline utilization regulon transcriptional repressor/proline dehydrogenase/delta 1-pyrroline-5-carboxylate dehydrogenase
MLEGMANHQRRALLERVSNMLLYAPICRKEHFLSAIGYLIRRLDENTGPENFLRHAFKLTPGSAEWQTLEKSFVAACVLLPTVSDAPRRTQDRKSESPFVRPLSDPFTNEPDTDWSLPHHAAWAQAIVARWLDHQTDIPLVIAGETIFDQRKLRDCHDPSRPGVVVGQYRQATADDILKAVECASRDQDGWRALSANARKEVLRRVASELRMARADLLGAALADGGKTLMESDPELSEAVDFVEFYADSASEFAEGLSPHIKGRGKGVVVVVSPWNFPIAIPCGGVAAALAAGNTVILKPASDAVLTAWEMCQCFWRGGISRQTLQFAPCDGGTEGKALVQHPKVNAVILTGGTETALKLLRDQPRLPLSAETGGKNATVVTALADRDLAIKNVLHSAFSHAGQKCSATSLLLLEAEIYKDAEFKRALVEAAQSISIGSAWELKTKMGPLIRPPSGDLEKALLTLEPGESWALQPHVMDGNPNLWTPGIKWGVQPGSYTHNTEFFGPMLAVMCFENLEEAISLVNQTGFGLTSGLESLDDREQAEWKAGILAGNLYINRGTTGAIVLRQPFGGMGKSAFGPGLKAGGPNYVAQFMDFQETLPDTPSTPPPDSQLGRFLMALQDWDTLNLAENTRLIAAFSSYARAWEEEFGREHDSFKLLGQDNIRRYRPIEALRIRIDRDDSPFEIFARVAAAHISGCRITISTHPGFESRPLKRLRTAIQDWAEFVEETDEKLCTALHARQADRVRYSSPQRVPLSVRRAAIEVPIFIADSPVLMEGRIELLWYVREQSVSFDYHRYGNLGARADEPRAIPL